MLSLHDPPLPLLLVPLMPLEPVPPEDDGPPDEDEKPDDELLDDVEPPGPSPFTVVVQADASPRTTATAIADFMERRVPC
jgi:hypothetical protein